MFKSASAMVIAARAVGYREFMSGRSVVLNPCPKCKKSFGKSVIRFRKVTGSTLVDRCWKCGYKAVVGNDSIASSNDPTLCPCGCGDNRPSQKAQYAHGRVCAARLKASLRK